MIEQPRPPLGRVPMTNTSPADSQILDPVRSTKNSWFEEGDNVMEYEGQAWFQAGPSLISMIAELVGVPTSEMTMPASCPLTPARTCCCQSRSRRLKSQPPFGLL